jgi:hypothetical protein
VARRCRNRERFLRPQWPLEIVHHRVGFTFLSRP